MCGRISQVELDHYYHRVYGWPLPDYKPRRNIKPTEEVPILVSENDTVKAVTARWWAQPDGATAFETKFATFNARLDRLDSSPLWRDLLKKGKRCVLPVSSFYEWPVKGKPPEEIYVEGRVPFGIAGLWSTYFEQDKPRYSFTVFTTEPNDFMLPIHPQAMPVILATPEGHSRWLTEGDRSILVPYAGKMESQTLPDKIEKVYPDEPADPQGSLFG